MGQARNTQRRKQQSSENESRLTADITALAIKYGRYGYRRITVLLKERGWRVNHKRVEHIWRQEGLKVPLKQPERGRLWLNDSSCIRLRPQYKDHVWSYDFVISRISDGRASKMLNIIDEYTREWLVEMGVQTLFIKPGSPWENGYIESFNGKLRDEMLNREIFITQIEDSVLIAQRKKEYNQVRPHSARGYKPPAPEAKVPVALTH